MNLEAKGAYIVLLSYCWNNNGLTKDQDELKEMCGNPENWEHIWGKVGKCFYEKNEKLYNKRLDKEFRKQQAWRRKSQLGGIKSGISRGKKVQPNVKGGSTKAQPKGNSSSSSSSSIKYKRIRSEKHSELAKLLEQKIKERMPKYKFVGENYIEDWANDVRLIEERDKRNLEEIEMIINWVSKDDFWYKNILSMSKLRKQFGRLWADMQDEGKKKGERIETPEEFELRQEKALGGKK